MIPLEIIQKNNQPEILLVEDTPEHIEAVVAVLQKNNFRIRIANKWSTALKLLSQHQPDLILLDIFMPEMDGFELCKTIKRNRAYSSIPIIFLTARDDEDSIRKGFELGAQDYVIKPFNTSELLARVKTHIKLKQQTESLKEANRELDSFCYTIAHDLKAPLLSINKLIEYLVADYRNELDSEGQELVTIIQEKSLEVIAIIEHLLEFSKMCEMPMQNEVIQLEHLFLDVYNELVQLQGERQVELNLKPLPNVTGDPVMMRMLVSNILSNALKYTRTREIAMIEVSFSESENEYTFAVKDNGVGFDMRYSARLFGVFQRLHSQNEFEGSGVGLAICQKILKRHNGQAWMIGEIDKGATFYFSFPKQAACAAATLRST
ncbi:response regulator [Desulfoscipio geothermicus]|uniref:response regulator n=1 Tax=Desulfoscipio geothermicus TaxID=39060 RepID=UPI000B821C05|nr:response regulator [Desulfoscipio geothermicus]